MYVRRPPRMKGICHESLDANGHVNALHVHCPPFTHALTGRARRDKNPSTTIFVSRQTIMDHSLLLGHFLTFATMMHNTLIEICITFAFIKQFFGNLTGAFTQRLSHKILFFGFKIVNFLRLSSKARL